MFGIPVAFYGTVATVISVLMVFIGLPRQILTNKREGNCKGLDKTLFFFVLCAYTSWSLYGSAQRNWFLIIANVPGLIFTLIIYWQIWKYREWFRWQKGRRDTGYFKMQFLQFGFSKLFVVDCYLLKFPVGSSAPKHAELVDGYRHYRCNFVLRKSGEGGKFWASRSFYNGSRLKIFRSDKFHEVTEIKGRARYVLSFGLATKR